MGKGKMKKAKGKIHGELKARMFAGGRFPLTPALSLGERENRLQPLSKTCDWICRTRTRKTETPRSLFPLPEGEGQGEGKRDRQISLSVSYH